MLSIRGKEAAAGRAWLEITADATLAPLEGVDSGDRGLLLRRGRVGPVGTEGGMLMLLGRSGSPRAIQARTVSRWLTMSSPRISSR
jgi:hypothetical protein